MMLMSELIEEFISLAIKTGGWMVLDRLYLKNKIVGIIGEETLEELSQQTVEEPVEDALTALVKVVSEFKKLEAGQSKELETQLADSLTPPPSVVNALFAQRYEKDPEDATRYFAEVNQVNHFVAAVKEPIVEENLLVWDSSISLSDATEEKGRCPLCMSNEGFEGDSKTENRQTQRLIRMNLLGETWNYQFERNPLFEQQAYFSSENHQEMTYGKDRIEKLVTLSDIFPHYFIGETGGMTPSGSAAESIEHASFYGAIGQTLLSKAAVKQTRKMSLFSSIELEELEWAIPAIRLVGKDKTALIQAAHFVEALVLKQVVASSSDDREYGLPLVIEKTDKGYVLTLVLLNPSVLSETSLDFWEIIGCVNVTKESSKEETLKQVTALYELVSQGINTADYLVGL